MTRSPDHSNLSAASEQSNPLLSAHRLPPFSNVQPGHVVLAITHFIDENRKKISAFLDNIEAGQSDFLRALEQWDDELLQAFSPVSHLNAVMNTDAMRDAYNACLPLLSQYSTEMGQNKELFSAYQSLKASAEFASLSEAQQAATNQALRDFHLAGVDLPADQQARYGEIKQQLSELTSKFGENVLDATQSWSKTMDDVSELAGLPDSSLQLLAQLADGEDAQYKVTLDFPSYLPIMTHADNRALREEVYTAFVTRASDSGPDAGKFDNSTLMTEILTLRQELATLLGFEHYADYSLATKMAGSATEVLDFLNDLASKSKPQAEREFAELSNFASEELGIKHLEPWDVTYCSEKLRQSRYAISQEDIRPYLPINTVLEGMFEVVSRLYGIQFEEQQTFDSYHPDVRFFHVLKDGQTVAAFYLDLYARSNKRGGAWMDDCRVRRQTEAGIQLPVAYLVCNFTPAVGDQPALLTHDELTTLFHEFGHGLHHMLTSVDVAAVSGINGVAWDAVELPSQFLENWCYEPEALALISGHVDSREPLPKELLDKLLAAKNFQSAMMMVRQLEFALFDFRLHVEYQANDPSAIERVLQQVREQVSVVPVAECNRFQHSFSHIFAGGYAAGYYSYKWAEVLSADAFSRFEEEGIFNRETGLSFWQEILSQGGTKDAAELFENFRGRPPCTDALLRHSGIDIVEQT